MSLVEVKQKEVWAESNIVARKMGMKHHELRRVIDNVAAEIKGDLTCTLKYPPVCLKEEREYRGQTYTACLMNRPMFSLVVNRLKTKRAREWQLKFNDAFYDIENQLLKAQANAASSEWKGIREQGKLARHEETDVIKQFIDYATAQGSTKANFYYSNITKLTYKAVGLVAQKNPDLRSTFDCYQLAEMMLMEQFVKQRIAHYMELGRAYKDIYACLREDVIKHGESGLFQNFHTKKKLK